MAVMGITGSIAQLVMKKSHSGAAAQKDGRSSDGLTEDDLETMEEAEVSLLESEGVYEEKILPKEERK